MLLSLAGIVAAAYLAMSAFLFLSQASLLYLPHIPTSQIEYTPAAINLAFENVHLETPDGETLHGWFVPAGNPDRNAAVLIFHGNAGNISHRLDTLRIWHALGYDSFIFDYRGYGESSGSPDEEGTYTDAQTAWDYLVGEKGIPPDRLVLFGRSMGGAIAAQLATRIEPAALIIESSFSSVPDIAADLYPWLPARLLSRFEYDTRAHARQARCPVMVIHSREDEIIPFEHGHAIYAAAATPKYMLTLQGSHNQGFLNSGMHYIEGLQDFLDTVFDE